MCLQAIALWAYLCYNNSRLRETQDKITHVIVSAVGAVRRTVAASDHVVEKTKGGHEKCQLFLSSSCLKQASISDITPEDGTPR